MRLWSIHPENLDPQGLVALWREALLAQAVLAGRTRGYVNHPQLSRFRRQRDPLASIATYLSAVAAEAERRGYSFDVSKVPAKRSRTKIPVTRGQVEYEWSHLTSKLKRRNRPWLEKLEEGTPRTHPLFVIVDGGIEEWERGGA